MPKILTTQSAEGGMPGRDAIQVQLYTRQDCPLCVKAAKFLRSQERSWLLMLTSIDINSDPQLQQAYGNCVPVVTVNGKLRFRGQINPVLWKRLMAHESKRASV
jgi:glutaredoxin